ncbi:hypothetical protein KFE25_005261 [Diacronema lutheri]|uniref:Uncharacterized protein n=1 Tax=Diacronema lutheri TaxID=2081491 RepID=A0A8J5X6N7_DIALT|nr:hypothetical protein KFE25_005261 [Diacronema lutheri]
MSLLADYEVVCAVDGQTVVRVPTAVAILPLAATAIAVSAASTHEAALACTVAASSLLFAPLASLYLCWRSSAELRAACPFDNVLVQYLEAALVAALRASALGGALLGAAPALAFVAARAALPWVPIASLRTLVLAAALAAFFVAHEHATLRCAASGWSPRAPWDHSLGGSWAMAPCRADGGAGRALFAARWLATWVAHTVAPLLLLVPIARVRSCTDARGREQALGAIEPAAYLVAVLAVLVPFAGASGLLFACRAMARAHGVHQASGLLAHAPLGCGADALMLGDEVLAIRLAEPRLRLWRTRDSMRHDAGDSLLVVKVAAARLALTCALGVLAPLALDARSIVGMAASFEREWSPFPTQLDLRCAGRSTGGGAAAHGVMPAWAARTLGLAAVGLAAHCALAAALAQVGATLGARARRRAVGDELLVSRAPRWLGACGAPATQASE